MSNVSVEYLVLRDNVEYSRLTAFKGGGAAISVTADAAVKWALSGKFAQNRAVNYLTDVIQPVLTIDGVRPVSYTHLDLPGRFCHHRTGYVRSGHLAIQLHHCRHPYDG